MCSTYEEGQLKPEKGPDFRTGLNRNCMKCKTIQAKVVIRVNDPFCKDCFVQYCTHKFRSAFGKSKVIRDGENVLLAFSGGLASTAMLHLVKEGKSSRAQKKLRFSPGLLYIDEGAVLDLTEAQRLSAREKITHAMEESGYPVHTVSLEQAMNPRQLPTDGAYSSHDDNTMLSDNLDSSSSKEKLIRMMNTIQSLTAKEQLLHTLRQWLLVEVAKKEGYSKVIIADTATRLSVTILSSFAQGKGAHIPFDTSLLDDRDKDMMFVRPLREFTSKEVAMYNAFHKLQPVILPSLGTMAGKGASINKLTESFVQDLQAGFPSTINTIMRTGNKLSTNEETVKQDTVKHKTESVEPANENSIKASETSVMDQGLDSLNIYSDALCVMCQAPLDTKVGQSSALTSIHWSEELAHQRTVENQASTSQSSHIWSSRNQEMKNACCYSCQQMVHDMNDVAQLPNFVLKDAAQRAKRKAMKETIQDCLL